MNKVSLTFVWLVALAFAFLGGYRLGTVGMDAWDKHVSLRTARAYFVVRQDWIAVVKTPFCSAGFQFDPDVIEQRVGCGSEASGGWYLTYKAPKPRP